MTLLRNLGSLRIGLLLLAIIDVFLSPAPGSYAIKEGWGVIPTLVAPAAAPILLMVILFDALMSKIRSNDSEGEESKKYKHIMYAELAVVAFLFAGWLPYFMAIGK